LHKDIQNLYKQQPLALIGNRVELDIRNTQGELMPYEVTFTNNYSEPVDTFSLFIRNITERKDTLKAKMNAERTAEAKTTFLSNMSHEIRTPLNVILGLSEILIKKGFDDKQLLKKNLEGISFSAKNLLSIVNDILDFSKIEAGKLTLQSSDFNLAEVITNLSNAFEVKAREKGLKLNTEIDPSIPDIVIGDQYRLNQIITNLLGNAIKFTKRGTIQLELKLVKETAEAVKIKFTVKDTGIGIPAEQLNKIFDSFYQVDEPEHAKINGTGLGLSITKELINLQDGKLSAESLVGEGSTFYFDLSFEKSKRKKLQDLEKPVDGKPKHLKGLTVLVAEDNKMNQFYI
ncbi:MAG: ATP-binding protein, partial [Bacteroidota bacterium]|nr:ATP-binding protein [Bacteroidota bacterium]